MVEAGVAAFKFSTFGTDPKRFPRIPPALLEDCFRGHRADRADGRRPQRGRRGGARRDRQGEGGGHHRLSRAWPVAPAADRAARHHPDLRDRRRDRLPGPCRALLARARLRDRRRLSRAGLSRATIECCIHYLVLDEENDVTRLGGKAKINPPIRPRAEVEKLWRHVAAGNVTLVSTDHVSWSEDRKTNPDMLANASGVPGLEVMVPLFVKGALERGIPLTWAAELMARQPGAAFPARSPQGRARTSARTPTSPS